VRTTRFWDNLHLQISFEHTNQELRKIIRPKRKHALYTQCTCKIPIRQVGGFHRVLRFPDWLGVNMHNSLSIVYMLAKLATYDWSMVKLNQYGNNDEYHLLWLKQKSLSSIHYAYEKGSAHPGYHFSRTLENLRKRHERYRSASGPIVTIRPFSLRLV
jgi:hypothetical protein